MRYFFISLFLFSSFSQASVLKEIHVPNAKKGDILTFVRSEFRHGQKVCIYRSKGDKFILSIDRAKKQMTRECRQKLKVK